MSTTNENMTTALKQEKTVLTPPQQLIELIKQSRLSFLQEYSDKVKVQDHQTQHGKYRIYGVEKTAQNEMNHKMIRNALLKEHGCDSIIQVVGDSASYGEQESKFAVQYLSQKLEQNPNSIILYGFTGHSDNGRLDANQIVNEWIDQAPERANRVIANIVDHHTSVAIKNWGVKISNSVRNFYLVHSLGETPSTLFGDDTISSDGLTDKVCFCLEGGIQSFRQAVYMMAQGTRVEAIANLRGDKNPATRHTITGEYLNYFSAAEFLNYINKLVIEKGKLGVSVKEIEDAKDTYLKDRHLFNPERNDSGTKKALFELAWKQFITEKVWEKLTALYVGLDFLDISNKNVDPLIFSKQKLAQLPVLNIPESLRPFFDAALKTNSLKLRNSGFFYKTSITDKEIVTFIAPFLKQNPHITSLDISDNVNVGVQFDPDEANIHAEGIRALVNIPTLKELDISENCLGDAEAIALSEGTNLEILNTSGNRFSAVGELALTETKNTRMKILKK
jgi:hypothetical protein